MSKGNTFENDFLKLIFLATAIAGLADNAASAPLASLYVSLHTADPGEAGDQTTFEVAHTPYARIAVSRGGGWTVTGNVVHPAVNIDFAQVTAGTMAPATHFGVGTASGGAGKLLYSGPLTPNITIANGVIPSIDAASTITED